MQSYTIDQNGDAVSPDGRVVGRRNAAGRLEMLPPAEAEAAAALAQASEKEAGRSETPTAAGSPETPAETPAGETEKAGGEKARESTETPVKAPQTPRTPDGMIPLRRTSPPLAGKEQEPRLSLPAPPSYTKYEVRPDSEFTVRFCLGFRDGRVQVYTEDAKYKLEDVESHWATFRMWNFREELDWRNKTTVYDPPSRSWRPDTGRLNELKLRHLLKDWSLTGSDPKFRLLHVQGLLSDESYAVVMGLYPAILDNLLYMMNQVLEGNG